MEWSKDAAERCAQLAAQHPKATPAELRKILSKAYPWGPREYHPYRAWCKAARRAVFDRETLQSFRPGNTACSTRGCLRPGGRHTLPIPGGLVSEAVVVLCTACLRRVLQEQPSRAA